MPIFRTECLYPEDNKTLNFPDYLFEKILKTKTFRGMMFSGSLFGFYRNNLTEIQNISILTSVESSLRFQNSLADVKNRKITPIETSGYIGDYFLCQFKPPRCDMLNVLRNVRHETNRVLMFFWRGHSFTNGIALVQSFPEEDVLKMSSTTSKILIKKRILSL